MFKFWIRIVLNLKKYEIISHTDHIQKVQMLTCHINQNIWSRIGQKTFCFRRIFRKSASEQSYKIFHCHFVSTIINFDVVTVHINIFILKLNNEVTRKLFEMKEVIIKVVCDAVVIKKSSLIDIIWNWAKVHNFSCRRCYFWNWCIRSMYQVNHKTQPDWVKVVHLVPNVQTLNSWACCWCLII